MLGDHLYYDLAMRSVDRLAVSMHAQLAPHGVSVAAISPGFTATEAILQAVGGTRPPGCDSVALVAEATLALLEDPERDALSGTTHSVAALAARYSVEDPEPVA